MKNTPIEFVSSSRLVRRAIGLLVLSGLVLCPSSSFAQTYTTASILGTVSDPSGAAVPDASVTLLEKATGEKRTVVTNASGLYSFPAIAVGTYELTVQAKGFRATTLTGLDMGVSKSYTVNVKLEVGGQTEVVEVVASSATELQTQDAQIGNVFDRNTLTRLPILSRSAGELLTLQPLVIPTTTVGFGNQGGAVSGARSDQSTFTLDGIDISDNSIGGGGNLRTVIPIPVDAVEEFRVGVAAPNSSFARSSGGQVALVSRSGASSFHGSAFWFHQNDELNANTWENNLRGVRKAELKDNRFGGRIGGPIWKKHTFFFFDYEGRRFPQALNVTRVVPSDTLRQGILQFTDCSSGQFDSKGNCSGGGTLRSYNLATSMLCGPSGNQACDPRGLGISPTIKALYSIFPKGNDPTASSVRATADRLNTIGFRSTALAPISDNQYWLRLDHDFNAHWRFNGMVTDFRELATSATQLDIRNGNVRATTNLPLRDNAVVANLAGQITSTLFNNVRFGWVRDRTLTGRISPASSARLLGLPGTDSSAGFIALAPAFPLMDAPIDVNTQDGRTQSNNNRNFQWADDLSWVKGNHVIQGGTNIRYLKILHLRDDKVVGSLASLVASVDQGSFVQIPDSARPPTCSPSVTTNCLSATDVTRWNKLYAATLGIVDNVSILTVRDGQFNPLPFGTALQADTTLKAYEFYAQDTWRLRPTLTLTYGLSYGWQTPPVEKLNRQTFIVDHSNGDKILNARDYIEAKRQAALNGAAYSPVLAYLPIGKSGRDGIHNIDRTNVAPRVSLAWNPGFSSGLLGSVLGSRKTVVRGGFGITYDRLNTVQSVIIPMLGVGFAQTINVKTPSCTATGTGGSSCGVATGNPGSTFRIGVDGTPPLPVVPSQTIPVVPPAGRLSELLSFQVDPDFRVGRNYVADLTIQRELPKKMLVELGWTGRYARRLPQAVNFSSSPYFLKDAQSGQTFAQAYDALAAQLRAGTPAAAVTPQAWFENQLPGVGTAGLAKARSGAIIDGRVSDIFVFMDSVRASAKPLPLPAFNSLQVLDLFMRTWGGRSNYNAGFVDLRRISSTASFDLNYTFSRSLDEVGAVQNTAGYLPTSFNQGLTYGPSFFDRPHVFNAFYNLDFPLGHGHRHFSSGALDKILGGWYTSGIFRAFSGRPQLVVQSDQVFGGGEVFSFDVGAIPLKGIPDSSVHSGVTGSGGIGVNSDPANGGAGKNLFADPAAAFNGFRKILLSQDTRDGHAHPLRTFPRWSFDMSVGKKISFTERVGLTYRADFLNIFNHPEFQNPSLNLTNPRAFGVVSAQWVPANRTAGSRWIQMSLRAEF